MFLPLPGSCSPGPEPPALSLERLCLVVSWPPLLDPDQVPFLKKHGFLPHLLCAISLGRASILNSFSLDKSPMISCMLINFPTYLACVPRDWRMNTGILTSFLNLPILGMCLCNFSEVTFKRKRISVGNAHHFFQSEKPSAHWNIVIY